MRPVDTISRVWNLSPATLNGLRREFDDAVEAISNSVRDTAAPPLPVTIWEDQSKLTIAVDVPGFTETDLEITVDQGVLTLAGNRNEPSHDGEVRHNEHRYGSFERKLRLHETLDPSTLSAEMENGVVTISIDRRAEAQPRKISIRQPNAE